MHMRHYCCLLAAGLAAGLCAMPVSGAGTDTGTGKTTASSALEKKRPGFLSHPKKKTPKEQLAYANSLRDAGKLSDAGRQYDMLVHEWSASAEAPLAQLEYARLLEKKRDYPAAFDEYEYLIQNYAGSFSYPEVLESQFRIANCVMTSRSGFLSGSDGLEKALPMFEKVVLNGPRWTGTAQAQFNIGWIQEQLGSYDLATIAYETVQQNYPAGKVAADAAFRQCYCLHVIARESPREERSSQAARSHLQKFLRDFPDNEYAGEAGKYLAEVTQRLAGIAFARALFYDKGGSRPKAALIAYTDFVNKFPDAEKAGFAKKRIEELTRLLPPADAGESDAQPGKNAARSPGKGTPARKEK